jgi:site-specific recombinase XerD
LDTPQENSISSLLTLAADAAEQRQLSELTRQAYKRTWRKVLALAAAEGYDIRSLPREKVTEYYGFLTRQRGASHHIQTKAALAFLFRVLETINPFAACLAPPFRPEAVEIRYLEAAAVAKVLLHLRGDGADYFAKLTSHLAEALFFTATRFHEWATLTTGKLTRNTEGVVIAVRLKVKGGKYRDMPVLPRLSESLQEWERFLESFKGHRLRQGSVEFAGSELVFPGRDGGPFTNQAFNKRLSAACRSVGVPLISAHGLRHSAATLLLNDKGRNLKELQELLGHKSLSTTARYIHIDKSRLRSVVLDLAS